MYRPDPIDISRIQLPDNLLALMEKLAENVHEVWAQGRLNDGWSYGKKRDDKKMETPCLVSYSTLPEKEKKYDRAVVESTLRAILTLGYVIIKVPEQH
ncbi:MAG: Ryanodine receptor Ryr [Chloroflexi bacterium]|nr:MAG: Ryanodine receptor Ryr [Chloroflexota bacterium]